MLTKMKLWYNSFLERTRGGGIKIIKGCNLIAIPNTVLKLHATWLDLHAILTTIFLQWCYAEDLFGSQNQRKVWTANILHAK